MAVRGSAVTTQRWFNDTVNSLDTCTFRKSLHVSCSKCMHDLPSPPRDPRMMSTGLCYGNTYVTMYGYSQQVFCYENQVLLAKGRRQPELAH